jgi:hypothetical protein
LIQNLKPSQPRCARCQGKMILDSQSGDSTCFTCGSVVYAVEPADREVNRPISHAGQSLN